MNDEERSCYSSSFITIIVAPRNFQVNFFALLRSSVKLRRRRHRGRRSKFLGRNNNWGVRIYFHRQHREVDKYFVKMHKKNQISIPLSGVLYHKFSMHKHANNSFSADSNALIWALLVWGQIVPNLCNEAVWYDLISGLRRSFFGYAGL